MEELSNSLGFYIKVIVHELDRRVNLYSRELDLTKSQAEILRYLCKQDAEHRPVRQKDIEAFFHVSNPTVSGILNRLESKNLICRQQSSRDGRIHYIRPTEAAWKLQQEIYQRMHQVESGLTEGIDPQLREKGLEFLRAVTLNIANQRKEHDFVKNTDCSDQAV